MKSLVVVRSSSSPRHVKSWIRHHSPHADEWLQISFGGWNNALSEIGIQPLDVNLELEEAMIEEGARLSSLLSRVLQTNPTVAFAKCTELNFADEWWRAHIESLLVRNITKAMQFKEISVIGAGKFFRESLTLEGPRFDRGLFSRLVGVLERTKRFFRLVGLFAWNVTQVMFFLLWLSIRKNKREPSVHVNRSVLWSTFPNAWVEGNSRLQCRILPPESFPDGEPLHFVSCIYSNSEKTKSAWKASKSFAKLEREHLFVEPHEKLSISDVLFAYLRKPEVDHKHFVEATSGLIGLQQTREHWLRFRLIDLPKSRMLSLAASRLLSENKDLRVLNLVGFEFIEGRSIAASFRKSQIQVWGVQHGVATIHHSWRLVYASAALIESMHDVAPDRLLLEGRHLISMMEPTSASRVEIIGAPRLSLRDLRPRPMGSGRGRVQCLIILDMHQWKRLSRSAVQMAREFSDMDFVVCPHPSQKNRVARALYSAEKDLSNLNLGNDVVSLSETSHFGIVLASGVVIELTLRRFPLFSFCPPGNLDLGAISILKTMRPVFDGTRESLLRILAYLREQQQTDFSALDAVLDDLIETTEPGLFRAKTQAFLDTEHATSLSQHDVGKP